MNKFLIFLLSAFSAIFLSACSFNDFAIKGSFDPTKSDYINENALPAGEYSSFVSKENTAVLQQIVSVLSSTKEVKSAKDFDSFISQGEFIKTSILKSKDSIFTQQPAKGYEDIRTSTLKVYADVILVLDDYIDLLKTRDISEMDDISSRLEILSSSLISLSTNIN